jgi:hypothetical protein
MADACREYILETFEYYKEQSKKYEWKTNIDEYLIENILIKERKFLDFAEKVGSEKTKSIVKTIKEKSGNKYFKVTDKMSYAIAKDLLENHSIEEMINLFDKKYQ